MAEEDDFLSRWSRRKRSVAAEVPPTPEIEAPVVVDEPEEADEAEVLERLGLPVPESLKEGDDFSVFMKAGVPEFLRKRALRVLWRSNPVLANLDGLNDYDDDFNSPELTQKVLATGYQVGRGFVKKVLEGEPEEDEPLPNDAPVAMALEIDEPQEITAEFEPVQHEEVAVADTEEPAPRPRRMRFVT